MKRGHSVMITRTCFSRVSWVLPVVVPGKLVRPMQSLFFVINMNLANDLHPSSNSTDHRQFPVLYFSADIGGKYCGTIIWSGCNRQDWCVSCIVSGESRNSLRCLLTPLNWCYYSNLSFQQHHSFLASVWTYLSCACFNKLQFWRLLWTILITSSGARTCRIRLVALIMHSSADTHHTICV